MRRLAIYVAAGCTSCARAREIGASLEGTYPGVRVDVIEVDVAPAEDVPLDVVAVPTYILDGIVVSLGNPRIETLREQLAAPAMTSG